MRSSPPSPFTRLPGGNFCFFCQCLPVGAYHFAPPLVGGIAFSATSCTCTFVLHGDAFRSDVRRFPAPYVVESGVGPRHD